VLLLVQAGHDVIGTTRSAEKALSLDAAGATAVVVDAFDADALKSAVVTAKPDVVIHQLTDLPQKIDPAQLTSMRERNARLRIEGTRNLVAASLAAHASRFIAQSVAFAYAPGAPPSRELDPLDLEAERADPTTIEGVAALEDMVLEMPGTVSVLLRYGRLYGPGTWSTAPTDEAPVHVDAAAYAALLAIERGRGIYNIAEDDGSVAIEKARRELAWSPQMRIRKIA
jgi:nucleoside-diphosphate-sugar epimerase